MTELASPQKRAKVKSLRLELEVLLARKRALDDQISEIKRQIHEAAREGTFF